MKPNNRSKTESDARVPAYPFAAIVGQEEMKQALILNVIDPGVGGLLIMGHRGTGKSTAVRALADLLPQISVIPGCPYRCDPSDRVNLCGDCREASVARFPREKLGVRVVELPLGATEDRVSGTIDIQEALRTGTKRFEPGLLARANRGFLYIDEVNLLEDHLVDMLLDVAATGVNRVEREGVSVEHPARFVLIGSGNPEEGELRPQLLDRFGLFVEVSTERDIDRRVEIVERREAFEANRAVFHSRMAQEQDALRAKILRARRSFAGVKIERGLLWSIARLCSELNVDGHRGELTITRAARALAAFEGRRKATEADVRHVAVMALRHRLRRDTLEETGGAQRIEQAVEQVFSAATGTGLQNAEGARRYEHGSSSNLPGRNGSSGQHGKGRSHPDGEQPGSQSDEARQAPSASLREMKIKLGLDEWQSKRETRSRFKGARHAENNRVAYNRERGRFTRSVSAGKALRRIALEASLRAAAAAIAGQDENSPRTIKADDLRYKVFKRKQGQLFIFAIDLSGSMALHRIARAREVILGLLRESYIHRDSVAIIGFRGASAELMLPPSKSIIRARRVLDALPTGGGTPLSAGLARSLELVKRVKEVAGDSVLLLFTDGGANVALREGKGLNRLQRRQLIDAEIARLGLELKESRLTTVVLDTQIGYRSTGDTSRIAESLGARFVKL